VATVEDALRSQIRNIETSTGRSIADWTALIQASGRTRHGEIVAWLKAEHGLTHGNANRLALEARNPTLASDSGASPAGESDPVAALYAGSRQPLKPIHDRLMAVIEGFGAPVEVAPKKGYVSLRRRTQFGMLKPAAKHVDLGLALPDEPVSGRLESAATWNGMFTHRVRVGSVDEVDEQLTGWLRRAWERAG
jgi:hypothetical protein